MSESEAEEVVLQKKKRCFYSNPLIPAANNWRLEADNDTQFFQSVSQKLFEIVVKSWGRFVWNTKAEEVGLR